MPGKKGHSGRKRNGDTVRFRPHLILARGKHDALIRALETAPPRHQGKILLAVIETGIQQAGMEMAALIEAKETALVARERAEIDAGLAGLGNDWDE